MASGIESAVSTMLILINPSVSCGPRTLISDVDAPKGYKDLCKSAQRRCPGTWTHRRKSSHCRAILADVEGIFDLTNREVETEWYLCKRRLSIQQVDYRDRDDELRKACTVFVFATGAQGSSEEKSKFCSRSRS